VGNATAVAFLPVCQGSPTHGRALILASFDASELLLERQAGMAQGNSGLPVIRFARPSDDTASAPLYASGRSVSWMAESFHSLPSRRTKVHNSVVSLGAVSSPSNTLPVARSRIRSTDS